MNSSRERKPSIIKRFQQRLLNSNKWEDYVIAFIIPLIPVVFSLTIHIWEPTYIESFKNPTLADICKPSSYTAYREAFNFLSLIAILPLSLFFLRFLGDKLFGTNVKTSQRNKVPILTCFTDGDAQNKIHRRLKETAINPIIPFSVLLFDMIFHFFDIGDVLKHYFFVLIGHEISCNEIPYIYWANLYLVHLKNSQEISIVTNFLFTASAYFSQFIIFFIGLTAIILLLLHNIFYLRLIYQRSRVSEEKIKYHIVLNFDDPSYRFGLNKINFVFNLQLIVLIFAGISLLFSRIVVTPRIRFSIPENFRFTDLFSIFSKQNIDLFLIKLFPQFGQYVSVLLWLFTFVVILLPTFIKFLPFFSHSVIREAWSIETYLREFIQPADERSKYPLTTIDQVNAVASKFAWNSFWPSGDDIARWIFYFVFFVCLIILFPLNLISTIIFCFIALFLGESFFNVYRWFLGHIDDRLVKRKETKPGDTILNNPQYDSSTNITNIVRDSPGAITNVGQYISDVTATVAQQSENSSASDEVKDLMRQLSEQIAAIDPSVDPVKVERMGKDLKALGEEMAGAEPRQRWYELSLEGIKEAATAIGEVAKPVVDIVAKLMPLLIP